MLMIKIDQTPSCQLILQITNTRTLFRMYHAIFVSTARHNSHYKQLDGKFSVAAFISYVMNATSKTISLHREICFSEKDTP